jgi:hypothetical protein
MQTDRAWKCNFFGFGGWPASRDLFCAPQGDILASIGTTFPGWSNADVAKRKLNEHRILLEPQAFYNGYWDH